MCDCCFALVFARLLHVSPWISNSVLVSAPFTGCTTDLQMVSRSGDSSLVLRTRLPYPSRRQITRRFGCRRAPADSCWSVLVAVICRGQLCPSQRQAEIRWRIRTPAAHALTEIRTLTTHIHGHTYRCIHVLHLSLFTPPAFSPDTLFARFDLDLLTGHVRHVSSVLV